MRKLVNGLWLGLLLLAPVTLQAEGLEEAQRLARSTDPDRLLEAAALYEGWLAHHPDELDDFDARLGAAGALNAVMAARTNANLPLVEGTQDTPENKALWAELGKRALAHARKAAARRPDSVPAAAELANAFMYHSASLGIVSAVMNGAAGEYKKNARRLNELDEGYDDGLGHFLLAGLYLVSPWPVGDMSDAKKHFTRAAELAPGSVRNQYGLGVYWAREEDAARARSHFERAVARPCGAGVERLFCDWMKSESKRVLATLEAS